MLLMREKRSPLVILFLTVFISMVGFGIVIPVLPVYAKKAPFLLNPTELGWLVGIFSLIQLVSSPVLGKLSDRIGRKPVLLVSVIGTAIGFYIIGRAESAWMLFLGRIIDGASGGNIATAQACVADVTPPEKRSKTMGLIGAAFGLGFIMGPALGGVLAKFSHAAPFYVACGLSVLNAVLIGYRLEETYPADKRSHAHAHASLGEVFANGRGAFILLLLLAALLSTTGFAFIHVLFALFCEDRFSWSLRETSYAFAYVGVLAVMVQGGLLRRLLQRNIEKQVAAAGALILAISLAWLPRVGGLAAFLGSCALMALGNGLLTPTLTGLASRHVAGSVQGRLMGLMASAGSLGRFLGPTLAVLPLPRDFTSIPRPVSADAAPALLQGYQTAFTLGAVLIGVSLFCVALLVIPPVPPKAEGTQV
jgi:DHA1 family tetracycline resistance protein-like MFS transporter